MNDPKNKSDSPPSSWYEEPEQDHGTSCNCLDCLDFRFEIADNKNKMNKEDSF